MIKPKTIRELALFKDDKGNLPIPIGELYIGQWGGQSRHFEISIMATYF